MSRVNIFFETFTSETTINSYKSTLRRFFKLMYGEGELEAQVERYANDKRDYEDDLRKFFISINHFSPTTVRQYLNIVKNFIEELRGEEFPRRFIRQLLRRRKGSRPITDDRTPTKEELRSILSHLDLKGKTLFLCLVSSGMRSGEALQIKLENIDLDANPVQVNLQADYTKTGEKRLTFVSQEAKELILQWLRTREEYIRSAQDRNKGLNSGEEVKAALIEDRRLFPFSSSTARHMWNLGLEKAGLDDRDPVTKYRKIRIHSLRKFFKTQLTKVDGAGEMPEGLLGHIDVYLKYSLEDFREFYSKAEYAVTIFGGVDLKELNETRKEIAKLSTESNRTLTMIVDQGERVKELERILSEKEREISDLNQWVGNLSEKWGMLEGLRERIEELESYLTPDGPVVKGEVEAVKKEAKRVAEET